MIPIKTPIGEFKVWTKRFGTNSKIKVLLLHGGPAMTHEYMECFETFFQREEFEFYEYDQLGSYYSDQPTDSSLWTIPRFVDEVEQVEVSKINWKKFSDNFLIVHGSGKTGPDWLNDKTWIKITNNRVKFSKTISLSNAKGIAFDPEYYLENPNLNPWIYNDVLYPYNSYKHV
ncbi:MAG: hypothetical protein ABIN25_05760 [Ginsengibacter sp.]